MTSVLRSIKQTPSAFFWSHGANAWYYDTIVDVFKGDGTKGTYAGPAPTYVGNVILFDNEDHFYEATNELFDNVSTDAYFDSYNTAQDIGKRIYIGVQGIESQMFTLSLARARDYGTGEEFKTAYALTAMKLTQYVNDSFMDSDSLPSIDLFRGGV